MKDNCVVAERAEKVRKAISSGCRMLAIREHSEQQIRIKLIKKGFEREAIDHCVDYLYDENWLSEIRYCNAFIRARAGKGQGLNRIASELQGQNIDQTIIDRQLELENINWQQVCESVLLKKMRPSLALLNAPKLGLTQGYDDPFQTSLIEITVKQKIKLENFLRYRGFSVLEIKIAIKRYLLIEHQEFK